MRCSVNLQRVLVQVLANAIKTPPEKSLPEFDLPRRRHKVLAGPRLRCSYRTVATAAAVHHRGLVRYLSQIELLHHRVGNARGQRRDEAGHSLRETLHVEKYLERAARVVLFEI